jgi:hypothetical protein
VIAATAEQTLNIMVLPVADGLATPALVNGVEDNGPVKFGAALASSMAVIDSGNTTLIGNNPEPETISMISVVVPADTSAVSYNVSGAYAPIQSGTIPGSGSAVVAFNVTTRTYTITSTLLTSSSNVALLSLPTRLQAESDLRQTIATFEVTIGPQHTDNNGQLTVIVTTQDVNLGVVSSNTTSFRPIRIQAVADPPTLSVSTPLSSTNEETSVPMNVSAFRSVDDDGSETLSVRFTVPRDAIGPIGIIKGTPPSSVTLANQGGGVYLVTSTGSTPSIRENNLNSFLQGNVLFEPRNGFSGRYTTNGTGIKVEAISTEGASGSELAPNSFGGVDGSTKTETATAWIQLTVNPVADAPLVSVKGNAAGSEDVRSSVAIPFSCFAHTLITHTLSYLQTRIRIPLVVTLGDPDGSESFQMKITNALPSGAKLFGTNGNLLPVINDEILLSPADVDALEILPPLHWSTPQQGDLRLESVITVNDTAIGQTSMRSTTFNMSIAVRGVADKPNSKSIVIEAIEDEKYPFGPAFAGLSGVLVDVSTFCTN